MFNSNTKPEDFKEAHGYEIDGKTWYPRVTKIVDIKSKPALYHFYAQMENFAAGERVKNRSAKEGTLIHETVEAIFMSKPIKIHDSIKPSISALFDFLEERRIKVLPEFVEKRLRNDKHRYAGTLDAVAEIDGKIGVMDIKTSQEIFRDYNLQTAAYIEAIKKDLPNIQTRWILRIDQSQPCIHCGALLRSKGGRQKVRIHWGNSFMRACKHEWGPMEGYIELKEFPAWEGDFKAFLGAKQLWEWENEEILRKIGYLK